MDNTGKGLHTELSGRQLTDLTAGVMFALFAVLFLLFPDGLQRDLFYNRGSDLLADFLNSVRHVDSGNPYALGHIQPPLGYLVLLPFTLFADFSQPLSVLWNSAGALTAAAVFVALSEVMLAAFLYIYIRERYGKTLPVLFWIIFSGVNFSAMERGTTVILSAGCVAGFFALYRPERSWKNLAALFLLSMAGALKIYPAVFILVLLKERDFRGVLWCALFSVLLGVLPFFCFPGGLDNIPLLLDNLAVYRKDFALSCIDLRMIHVLQSDFSLAGAEKYYVIFRNVADVIVLFSCGVAFLRGKRDFLVFALACFVALCPAGAMGYTLLYLAVPFADFYAQAERSKIAAAGALTVAVVYTPLRFVCQMNMFFTVVACCLVLLMIACAVTADWVKNRSFKEDKDVF